MNIITILSDEHSYEMMHFINHSILRTPNLDRLAAEGIVFDNFLFLLPCMCTGPRQLLHWELCTPTGNLGQFNPI